MVRLGDITGKAISGEWGLDDETGYGIPVLRTTNFTNEGIINYSNVITRNILKKDLSLKYLQPGDIIIEKSGGSDTQPVGRVVYFDGEANTYLFNNFTGVLRIKDTSNWDTKYLFYALYSNYLKGGTRKYQNKTTGLHNLKTEQFVREFEVCEYSISEQRQIVAVLDKVSDLIVMRKQQLAKLDELVKSRFVEIFGDPVSNPFKWEKVPLSELADIKIGPFGSLLHKDDYVEDGHPLVNPSHIKDGKIVTDSKLTISDEKFGEMADYHLKIGDVVMGRRGEMGRCAVVTEEGLLCGTGSLLIRSKGEITANYIQKIISFPSFKKIIEDMAVGQTMPNLNVPIVSNFKIIKPPIGVQHKYYSFVHQIDKLKLSVQQSLKNLEILKKMQMQKYFG